MQFADFLEKKQRKNIQPQTSPMFLGIQFGGGLGFLYESSVESFQQEEIPAEDREWSIGSGFYDRYCDRLYDRVFLHHKKHFIKPGIAHDQHRLCLKLWF